MKHVKTYEGFFSKLFGKKEEDKKTNSGNKGIDIDGVMCTKVWRVLGFAPNQVEYWKDEDDNRLALVGNNYSGKAVSGTFDDKGEASDYMNQIGALRK